MQSPPWLRRNRIVKLLPSPSAMADQVQQQLKSWAAMRMRDPAETDKVRAGEIYALAAVLSTRSGRPSNSSSVVHLESPGMPGRRFLRSASTPEPRVRVVSMGGMLRGRPCVAMS